LAWRTPGKTGFIVTRDPATTSFQNHPITIGEGAYDRLKTLVKPGLDVYFTVAEYNSSVSRKGKNIHAIYGFHVDLDCGADKAVDGKGYTDWETAREALDDFLKKSGLPGPTVIIKSGGGLHCYWYLTEGLSHSAWKDSAVKLKSVAKALSFFADPARTSDPASLMRACDTKNQKYAPPRPVKVLKFSDDLIAKNEMCKAIEAASESAKTKTKAD